MSKELKHFFGKGAHPLSIEIQDFTIAGLIPEKRIGKLHLLYQDLLTAKTWFQCLKNVLFLISEKKQRELGNIISSGEGDLFTHTHFRSLK